MKLNSMVIDLDRCIGCKGCQIGCKQENGVALGSSRINVLTIGPTGKFPDLEMYFLPVRCQVCTEPSCVKVCPTGACHVDSGNGSIQIDRDMCIGCRSCSKACPYGANLFNNELKVMDKCTLCEHMQKVGEKPACVKNCAGRAMFFGDINDPDSEVSRLLREAGSENVFSLRDTGNHPSVRYILRKAKWVDVLPSELSGSCPGRV
ncbi:MAG: 4Fe-4S dicluster domain-containing protein [Clostridiales bacterium]|nr:4Fe-4S dicluster domain-containing protein [Clostridiales bacterium]